jgi:large subunit ribosomal protein L25
MAEIQTIAAKRREKTGKGPARAARRANFVPAIIYGGQEEPAMVAIERAIVDMEIHKPAFFGTILDIKVNGESIRVLPRELQLHPVTENALHLDLLRVTERTRISVNVPVVFENEDASPGLSRGGVLNVVRYEIEVVCQAGSIPAQIVADVGGLDIGDSLHISMIDLPAGVRPAEQDRDFTIAAVATPTVMSEEEEEGEGEEDEMAEGDAQAPEAVEEGGGAEE